jgi:hypothetical protein
MGSCWNTTCLGGVLIAMLSLSLLAGCPMVAVMDGDGADSTQPASSGDPKWDLAFDASGIGVLSAVWGSGDDDIFVVGGTDEGGEVHHFDGVEWSEMAIPRVPLLVWVFGFGSDDVIAVGEGGGVICYDGTDWTSLDSGTSEDLWGVWGSQPNDLWIVGGTIGEGDAELIHFDGETFTPFAIPENDRNVTSLFKVWGIGSKTFAVGQNGLIIEFDGEDWVQVPTGAEAVEDFVSLWGTSEDNIVAVGGRGIARISVYDGSSWTTQRFGSVGGLNAVFMLEPTTCVVGGVNGFVGSFDIASGELTAEESGTGETVHGIWANRVGRYYGVGGRFSPPQRGLALVRTLGDEEIEISPPRALPEDDSDVAVIDCNRNGVEDALDLSRGDSDDCNNDGVPDECDANDRDGDGVPDACDTCPDDALDDSDGDGACDSDDICAGFDDFADADGDGRPDGCDSCEGFDDREDADADGVADECDICAAGDDHSDADDDGVPDACDKCAGFDDAEDSDGDGVADGCDRCEGSADDFDADGDGVPDGCDACPGFDDASDADGDGVPDGCESCNAPEDEADDDGDGVVNSCDRCPGFDDALDADNDGTPDNCDVCANFSDAFDADGDGVPDGCDLCALSNDAADADSDGVPDGCDACPGFDDAIDADADGSADGCDACPGFDDTVDADSDGVPDGCDVCSGFDDASDADADGVPDGCDVCPGFDDTADCNGNMIPDGCDNYCQFESDCALGEICSSCVCLSTAQPDIQFGVATQSNPCVFQELNENDTFAVFAGPQGFVDAFISFQVTGFAAGALVNIERSMLATDNDEQLVFQITSTVPLADIGNSVGQFCEFYLFINSAPANVDGREVRLMLTVTDFVDSDVTTSLEQVVVLDVQN